MKVFLCRDNDCGRDALVVCKDIKTAITLFEMMHDGIPPEKVFDLTTEDEMVIIEGHTAQDMEAADE